MAQGDRKNVGRDHHKEGFTVWMAGGGVKGGGGVYGGGTPGGGGADGGGQAKPIGPPY